MPGEVKYVVTVHLVADFDGELGEGGGPGELERLLRLAEEKSEEELMNEVVQDLCFMLCKPCRDAWVKAPCGERGEEPIPLH